MNISISDLLIALEEGGLQTVTKEEVAAALARELVVNRFEVIDGTQNGEGRAYKKWEDFRFRIEFSEQDGGRTLKVFLIPLGETPQPGAAQSGGE